MATPGLFNIAKGLFGAAEQAGKSTVDINKDIYKGVASHIGDIGEAAKNMGESLWQQDVPGAGVLAPFTGYAKTPMDIGKEKSSPIAAATDPAGAALSYLLHGQAVTSEDTAKAPKATTDQVTSNAQNPAQQILDEAMKPYWNMLTDAVNSASQALGSAGTQSWIPGNIKGAIGGFQKLTGQSLQGLMPNTRKAEENFIQGSAIQQLLNIIPTAMLYHVISGNLPGFPASDKGVQTLWKILENMNMGVPNPQSANAKAFAIQGLTTPDANAPSTDQSGGSTTGG